MAIAPAAPKAVARNANFGERREKLRGIMLPRPVKVTHDIFVEESPLPAEFGALEFSLLGKNVNGGERDPQKFAHLFNRHHLLVLRFLIHSNSGLFIDIFVSAEKNRPLLAAPI